MSDIAKRLSAALKYDVMNGDAVERGVLAKQIKEAVVELDRLAKSEAFHTEACGAHQRHIDELTAENAALRGQVEKWEGMRHE